MEQWRGEGIRTFLYSSASDGDTERKEFPTVWRQHGHPASQASLRLKTEKVAEFLQTFLTSPGPVAFMHLINDPGGHDLVSRPVKKTTSESAAAAGMKPEDTRLLRAAVSRDSF